MSADMTLAIVLLVVSSAAMSDAQSWEGSQLKLMKVIVKYGIKNTYYGADFTVPECIEQLINRIDPSEITEEVSDYYFDTTEKDRMVRDEIVYEIIAACHNYSREYFAREIASFRSESSKQYYNCTKLYLATRNISTPLIDIDVTKVDKKFCDSQLDEIFQDPNKITGCISSQLETVEWQLRSYIAGSGNFPSEIVNSEIEEAVKFFANRGNDAEIKAYNCFLDFLHQKWLPTKNYSQHDIDVITVTRLFYDGYEERAKCAYRKLGFSDFENLPGVQRFYHDQFVSALKNIPALDDATKAAVFETAKECISVQDSSVHPSVIFDSIFYDLEKSKNNATDCVKAELLRLESSRSLVSGFDISVISDARKDECKSMIEAANAERIELIAREQPKLTILAPNCFKPDEFLPPQTFFKLILVSALEKERRKAKREEFFLFIDEYTKCYEKFVACAANQSR